MGTAKQLPNKDPPKQKNTKQPTNEEKAEKKHEKITEFIEPASNNKKQNNHKNKPNGNDDDRNCKNDPINIQLPTKDITKITITNR